MPADAGALIKLFQSQAELVRMRLEQFAPIELIRSTLSSVHPNIRWCTSSIRTYTAADGKLDALESRFRDHTMNLFERHGMKNIAYWIPVDVPNTLIYAGPPRPRCGKSPGNLFCERSRLAADFRRPELTVHWWFVLNLFL